MRITIYFQGPVYLGGILLFRRGKGIYKWISHGAYDGYVYLLSRRDINGYYGGSATIKVPHWFAREVYNGVDEDDKVKLVIEGTQNRAKLIVRTNGETWKTGVYYWKVNDELHSLYKWMKERQILSSVKLEEEDIAAIQDFIDDEEPDVGTVYDAEYSNTVYFEMEKGTFRIECEDEGLELDVYTRGPRTEAEFSKVILEALMTLEPEYGPYFIEFHKSRYGEDPPVLIRDAEETTAIRLFQLQ